jgi:hypothetical protein
MQKELRDSVHPQNNPKQLGRSNIENIKPSEMSGSDGGEYDERAAFWDVVPSVIA